MDAYGRRIIGSSMADHLRTELVLDALSMAITRRPPARQETILHSDHGNIRPGISGSGSGNRVCSDLWARSVTATTTR